MNFNLSVKQFTVACIQQQSSVIGRTLWLLENKEVISVNPPQTCLGTELVSGAFPGIG